MFIPLSKCPEYLLNKTDVIAYDCTYTSYIVIENSLSLIILQLIQCIIEEAIEFAKRRGLRMI